MRSVAKISNRFYIEQQVRRMIENPGPAYSKAWKLAQQTDRELVGKIHIAEVVPYPPPLASARKKFSRNVILLNLAFSLPWFYLSVSAFAQGNQGSIIENWPFVWRLLLAGVFAFLHWAFVSAWFESVDAPLRSQEAEFRRDCENVIAEMSHEFN